MIAVLRRQRLKLPQLAVMAPPKKVTSRERGASNSFTDRFKAV